MLLAFGLSISNTFATSVHDNATTIVNFTTLPILFDWDGNYCITDNQPWGDSDHPNAVYVNNKPYYNNKPSTVIDVFCGRKGSAKVTNYFSSAAGSDYIGMDLGDSTLNFAIKGILTIGEDQYKIIIAQTGIRWLLGGTEPGFKAGSQNITTPDKKFTISLAGNNTFNVFPYNPNAEIANQEQNKTKSTTYATALGDSPNNDFYITSYDNSITNIEFDFSGDYSIDTSKAKWTSLNPSYGVDNKGKNYCDITVVADRKGSDIPANYFNYNKVGKLADTLGFWRNSLSSMNFAFKGTLKIEGNQYDMVIGQFHTSANNAWAIAGTKNPLIIIPTSSAVLTPDSKYQLRMGDQPVGNESPDNFHIGIIRYSNTNSTQK